MRIHVFADLHLEFGPFYISETEADVVVAAGDIGTGRRGLDWLKDQFRQPVVYVLGNHEYYGDRLYPALATSLESETHGSNIHVLECSSVEVAGFKFLGCTLWTDFGPQPAAAQALAEQQIMDYQEITDSRTGQRLSAQQTVKIHEGSVAWLKSALKQGDPARTVIVTHHGPSLKSEAPFHANSPLTPAFLSNLDDLVRESGVPLWIHGHTHYNVDYQLGRTRVLSNQRGYGSECKDFRPRLVVEV